MVLPIGVAMGLNFASGLLKGAAQSNKAKAEANAYRQSAANYRHNATKTRLSGAVNEDILRAQNRANLARSSAALSEAGMGESPTAASALAATASAMEQNVLNSRYQTENEAENYLYQARIADANARALKKKSGNMFRSGLINGISSAFSVMQGEKS